MYAVVLSSISNVHSVGLNNKICVGLYDDKEEAEEMMDYIISLDDLSYLVKNYNTLVRRNTNAHLINIANLPQFASCKRSRVFYNNNVFKELTASVFEM